REHQSILDGVPKSLPSLAKASKLQKKAAKVGFDWIDVKDIWGKLVEEILEVNEAIDRKEHAEVEQEFGDVLFVLANLSRYYKVNHEIALNQTNQKFTSSYSYIEQQLEKQGKDNKTTTLEEMDYYWNMEKGRE